MNAQDHLYQWVQEQFQRQDDLRKEENEQLRREMKEGFASVEAKIDNIQNSTIKEYWAKHPTKLIAWVLVGHYFLETVAYYLPAIPDLLKMLL